MLWLSQYSHVKIVERLSNDLRCCHADTLLLLKSVWLLSTSSTRAIMIEERVLDERARLRFQKWASLADSRQAADQLLEQILVCYLDLERLDNVPCLV